MAPLLTPALVAGWLFIFLIANKELAIAVLLASPGSQVIAVAIFDQWVNGQGGELAAFGLIWTVLMTVDRAGCSSCRRGAAAPMCMGTESMLSVRGLTKIYANRFDAQAGGVRDVSFELPPGTFFTLLGPSGCGKTTTLRCIAGLERPDAGQIRGRRTRCCSTARRGMAVPMNRRGIGMVFQSYAIWPHMTVFENIAFPLRVAASGGTRGRRSAGWWTRRWRPSGSPATATGRRPGCPAASSSASHWRGPSCTSPASAAG